MIRWSFGDKAGLTRPDLALRAASWSHDRRHSGGHGLQHSQTNRVSPRGKQEQIHIGEGSRQRGAPQRSPKIASAQMALQPGALTAAADHHDAKTVESAPEQVLFDSGENANIFLRREPSDITENQSVITAAAIRD
jgi:hypothetical protein